MKFRRLGDLTLQRAVDIMFPLPVDFLFSAVPREAWDPYLDWLSPDPLNIDKWELTIPIQTIIVRTHHHNILIDTCFGNHKDLPQFPVINGKSDNRYMVELALHGLTPEDIDFVMCTHLHSDHNGWNTRLENGEWVPTFPNARYIFSRKEFEFWADGGGVGTMRNDYRDNVLPVYEAGLVDLVTNDFQLDDNVWLAPTPGHTLDHVAVNIKSKGEHAVVIGDVMHCPVQCQHPEWHVDADRFKDQAAETRRCFLDSHCDTDILVIPPHFPLPSAGHVRRQGESFRLKMDTAYW